MTLVVELDSTLPGAPRAESPEDYMADGFQGAKPNIFAASHEFSFAGMSKLPPLQDSWNRR
jgi:hypothetical protein